LHVLYASPDKTLSGVATFLSDPSRDFEDTLWAMMSTNHLGDRKDAKVHPVAAQAARELLNKSECEACPWVKRTLRCIAPRGQASHSTAMSFLSLYRDPTIAEVTSKCDWRIEDLVSADKPVSLYLVVPPSDISRTKPLIRLILNQIGRRLTESLETNNNPSRRKVLFMLDEFPALGRLEFFESALAFMAGYGLRAFLIAQSLNQIEKAYGPNNSILDNCHVRVAFATNDERTAKRISDAVGSTTEMRAMRNYAGHRLAPWLSHVMVSRQETARQLLTPGEVMQLPNDEEIILLSGFPPIKANKLRYYADKNFTGRVMSPPSLSPDGSYPHAPLVHGCDWNNSNGDPMTRPVDDRLLTPGEKPRSNKSAGQSGKDRKPELPTDGQKPKSKKNEVQKDRSDEDTPEIALVQIGQLRLANTALQQARGLSQSVEPDLGMG